MCDRARFQIKFYSGTFRLSVIMETVSLAIAYEKQFSCIKLLMTTTVSLSSNNTCHCSQAAAILSSKKTSASLSHVSRSSSAVPTKVQWSLSTAFWIQLFLLHFFFLFVLFRSGYFQAFCRIHFMTLCVVQQFMRIIVTVVH